MLFVEKKILRAAGIQSVVFLIICIFVGVLIREDVQTKIMANVIEDSGKDDKASHPDYIYVIDAGHGGVDSGTLAANKKYDEKTINFSIANMVKELLEQDKNTKVYMTRENDQFLSPEQRVKFINEKVPDMVISIHCNSADNLDASGVEVLYNTKNEESKELSSQCLGEIIKSTKQVNRGLIKGDNIYIVRNSNVPIALIEVGFLSNKEELNYLLKEENQERIAKGIVNGIRKTEGKRTKI